jgi:hypothetical protein
MEQILDIIIKVFAALLALGAGWLGKYLINLLKTKLNDKQVEKLNLFIAELVAAAEQMYRKDDPDGSIRLNYVQDMLIDAGYELTEAVKALIESSVFSINLVNRSEKLVDPAAVTGFGGDDE